MRFILLVMQFRGILSIMFIYTVGYKLPYRVYRTRGIYDYNLVELIGIKLCDSLSFEVKRGKNITHALKIILLISSIITAAALKCSFYEHAHDQHLDGFFFPFR